MKTTKILIIGMLTAMLILLIPLAYAATFNGVTITKEVSCSATQPIDDPDLLTVPLGEYEQWGVHITVVNDNDFPITNVRVSDRFGGEFGVVNPPMGMSQGTISCSYSGATAKVSIFWDVGTIPAHGSATLFLAVYADINLGGNQEFTSVGCHYMNSGATAKWLDADGHQQSVASEPIVITVV